MSIQISRVAPRFIARVVRSPTSRRSVATMVFIEKSPAECKKLMEDKHSYLDVRSEQEFSGGHVDGAKNIPFMFKTDSGMEPNPNFMSQIKEAYPDMDVSLVVGCASGRRSGMAIEAMQAEGYKNLVNVGGGYTAWSS